MSVSEITKVGLLTSLSNSLNCGGTKQIKSATRERKRERVKGTVREREREREGQREGGTEGGREEC